MPVDPQADTVNIPPPPKGGSSITAPLPYSSLVRVDLAGDSHVGHVRENNEDHFLVARFGRFFDVVSTNLRPGEVAEHSGETGYGMIVADGMGGTVGGEVASRLAIRTLINLVLQVPDWILRLDEEHAQEALERATKRMREVDAAIGRRAARDPALSRMGTTLTVAHSLGKDLFVAHVGDSRAYLLRKGRLCRLTRDQTFAQALVDQGVITPEQAAHHRMRHVLTSFLGKHQGETEIEVERMELLDGDCLLLCTDGLTEMVPDDRIAEALAQAESSEAACQALIQMALNGGGRDNVTTIVARYQLPPPDKQSASK